MGVFALAITAFVADSLRSLACAVIACICAWMNFHLQPGEVLDVPHLRQPLCKVESAPDIALGITEDLIAQFRLAHDNARNAALKEVEVAVDRPSNLLHALFGHFAQVGWNFELWCRAHNALHCADECLTHIHLNRDWPGGSETGENIYAVPAFSQDRCGDRRPFRCWLLMSGYRWALGGRYTGNLIRFDFGETVTGGPAVPSIELQLASCVPGLRMPPGRPGPGVDALRPGNLKKGITTIAIVNKHGAWVSADIDAQEEFLLASMSDYFPGVRQGIDEQVSARRARAAHDWRARFDALVADVSSDDWFAIVDCHR